MFQNFFFLAANNKGTNHFANIMGKLLSNIPEEVTFKMLC